MKTLIAIPCMDKVDALFMSSCIGMEVTGEIEFCLVTSSLIYDARNRIAEKAVKEGFDRILWLDSDMVFDADLFKRLSARMDEGYKFVTGLYFTRKGTMKPVIYKYVGMRDIDGVKTPVGEHYFDYPKDTMFSIAGAGMGGCMVDVQVVREIFGYYGAPFAPLIGFGEDLSFCKRIASLNYKMWCDSSIKLGHIALRTINEESYFETIGGSNNGLQDQIGTD